MLTAAAAGHPDGEEATGGPSQDCLACHAAAKNDLLPHPLDVPVLGRVPGLAEGLPLWNGTLTCLTCHQGHRGKSGTSPFNLRQAPPDLCGACHRDAEGHWDRGHAPYADTVHGGAHLALFADTPDLEGPGQPVGDRCLVCHSASPPGKGLPAPPPSINPSISHPMGPYAAAAAGRRGLRRESLLPAALRLQEGKVTCATCHRLFGGGHYHMPINGARKETCLGCHSFDEGELVAGR